MYLCPVNDYGELGSCCQDPAGFRRLLWLFVAYRLKSSFLGRAICVVGLDIPSSFASHPPPTCTRDHNCAEYAFTQAVRSARNVLPFLSGPCLPFTFTFFESVPRLEDSLGPALHSSPFLLPHSIKGLSPAYQEHPS